MAPPRVRPRPRPLEAARAPEEPEDEAAAVDFFLPACFFLAPVPVPVLLGDLAPRLLVAVVEVEAEVAPLEAAAAAAAALRVTRPE